MAQGRKKVFQSEQIVEALKNTSTITAAAQLCDCSAPLIHQRASLEPAVAAAIQEQDEKFETLLAESIMRHNGKLRKVALEVGLDSASAVRYYVTRSQKLHQVFLASRENLLDHAEDNIYSAVEQGDLSYSWKVLQTLGKDRGYTERRELEATVTHSIDQASTGALLQLLNRISGLHPTAVEAEFSELSEEEREELSSLLSEEAA